MSARGKSEDPWTVKEVIKSAIALVFFVGILFAIATPLIVSEYNKYNYTMRECTVVKAKARESRTVTYSTQLSIYTSDCGTLVYEVGAPDFKLEEMADYINGFKGEKLGFGFGNIQLQSNLSTVSKIEGFE